MYIVQYWYKQQKKVFEKEKVTITVQIKAIKAKG